MKLLAHRGNLHGPDRHSENTQRLIEQALALGFDVETDIRRDADGRLYISHDPTGVTADNFADAHAKLWTQFPNCEVALNVKELGYEPQLVEFIRQHGLQLQVFLFDFELLEDGPGTTAAMIHKLAPGIRLAARVSDRNGETIAQAMSIRSTSIIWLDEFDSLWATRDDVQRLKESGCRVYAISPEIHGFTLAETELRWTQFADWGVDGICTDFPIRAKEVLALCD